MLSTKVDAASDTITSKLDEDLANSTLNDDFEAKDTVPKAAADEEELEEEKDVGKSGLNHLLEKVQNKFTQPA